MTEADLIARHRAAADPAPTVWLLALRALPHPDEDPDDVAARQARLIAAGAVPALLTQLASDDPLHRVMGTTALGILSHHPSATLGGGSAAPLTALLSSKSPDEAAAAADVVRGFALHGVEEKARLAPAIPALLALLTGSHNEAALLAGGALWSLTTGCNEAAVVQTGGVPTLLELLDDEHRRAAAAGTLANLANGGDGCRAAIVQAGGIPALLTALAHFDARQSAAGALWNLTAGDENRSAIVQAGGFAALIPMLSSEDAGVQYAAAGLIGNLVRLDQGHKDAFRTAGGIPPLVILLRTDDERLFHEALRAVKTLGFENTANQQAIEAAEGFEVVLAKGMLPPEAPPPAGLAAPEVTAPVDEAGRRPLPVALVIGMLILIGVYLLIR